MLIALLGCTAATGLGVVWLCLCNLSGHYCSCLGSCLFCPCFAGRSGALLGWVVAGRGCSEVLLV